MECESEGEVEVLKKWENRLLGREGRVARRLNRNISASWMDGEVILGV